MLLDSNLGLLIQHQAKLHNSTFPTIIMAVSQTTEDEYWLFTVPVMVVLHICYFGVGSIYTLMDITNKSKFLRKLDDETIYDLHRCESRTIVEVPFSEVFLPSRHPSASAHLHASVAS